MGSKTKTRFIAVLLTLCLSFGLSAWAEDPQGEKGSKAKEPTDLKKEMNRLKAIIDELESRTDTEDAEVRRLRLMLREMRRRIVQRENRREWYPDRGKAVNGFRFAADTAGFVLLREGMGDRFRRRVISDMHGQVVRIDGYLFDATDGYLVVPVDHPYGGRFRGKPVADGCGWWAGMYSGESSGTPIHIPTLDVCDDGGEEPRFFAVFFLPPEDAARPWDLSVLKHRPKLHTRTDYKDRKAGHRVVVQGVVDGPVERAATYPDGPRRVVAISLRDWLRVP